MVLLAYEAEYADEHRAALDGDAAAARLKQCHLVDRCREESVAFARLVSRVRRPQRVLWEGGERETRRPSSREGKASAA